MVVLVLFNDAEQLTTKEIAAATSIPDAELKRTLQASIWRCCCCCCRSTKRGDAGIELHWFRPVG